MGSELLPPLSVNGRLSLSYSWQVFELPPFWNNCDHSTVHAHKTSTNAQEGTHQMAWANVPPWSVNGLQDVMNGWMLWSAERPADSAPVRRHHIPHCKTKPHGVVKWPPLLGLREVGTTCNGQFRWQVRQVVYMVMVCPRRLLPTPNNGYIDLSRVLHVEWLKMVPPYRCRVCLTSHIVLCHELRPQQGQNDQRWSVLAKYDELRSAMSACICLNVDFQVLWTSCYPVDAEEVGTLCQALKKVMTPACFHSTNDGLCNWLVNTFIELPMNSSAVGQKDMDCVVLLTGQSKGKLNTTPTIRQYNMLA